MSQTIPTIIAEFDATHILKHRDEFYWQYKSGGREYGPFPTLLDAVEDMQYQENSFGIGESLEEAEDEIGIANWIDPETGLPAEEGVPRIEEH